MAVSSAVRRAATVPPCLRVSVVKSLAASMLVVSMTASIAAEDPPEDLGKTLAAAVDLATPELRLAAAAKLAARSDVTLTQWLDVMRKFGGQPRTKPGPRTETAVLRVGDADEKTDIAVYVPPGYAPGTPAPLLLALHGAGGEGHDEQALWQAAADTIGMIVVAPTDKTADLGLEVGQEAPRQRVMAALRWARRTFDIDENRVFLAGVSRGGHLAWDVALRNPDRFAALAPMIGGPRLQLVDGQNNIRYTENLAHMPIRDLQGSRDHPLLIKNLKLAFRRLEDCGARDAKLILQPDLGHDFDPHAVDWVKFLGAAARQSEPMRVVRACARSDEARSFWAEALRFAPSVEEKFRALIKAKEAKDLEGDEDGMRAWAQEEADKRTARLEVKLDAPGKFTATTKLVQRFRILLSAEMFDDAAPVEVTTNGKLQKYTATPSKLVLLKEFVERFDRTFLPVAEVSCP